MDSYETVIVAVHYNRAIMVEKSIKSVVNQLTKSELLLLIDDGSTDNTLEELNKFSGENIKVLTWENRGFTPSVIKAINLYNSQYIAIHGAGDVSLPGRFLKQEQVLKNNINVVVVGTHNKNIDMRTKTEKTNKDKIDESSKELILKKNPFIHSGVMFRRDAYQKAGGYRSLFKFAQDRDLWCRMSFFGDFYVIDEVLVERYNAISDSVSGNYYKALQQRYLSDFAIYCHRLRMKYGFQADKNIELTMIEYAPSYRVQYELFYNSLKLAKRKKFDEFVEYKKHVGKCLLLKLTYQIVSPVIWFLKYR